MNSGSSSLNSTGVLRGAFYIKTRGEMTMFKVYTTDNCLTVIDGDQDVIDCAQSASVSPNDFWTYTDGSGELITVDISACRPHMDVLSNLYRRACATKRPDDAAAYMKHKTRILAMFNERDMDGQHYE